MREKRAEEESGRRHVEDKKEDEKVRAGDV